MPQVGVKRVILFPPSDSPCLYPFPAGSGGAPRVSRVNLAPFLRAGGPSPEVRSPLRPLSSTPLGPLLTASETPSETPFQTSS
eukprot:314869-Prorocentrum_minimum.AAC.1